MGAVTWQDVTSYSRDRKNQEPSAWRADYGEGLSISVTCRHVLYKGQWVMHCHALGIDTKPMPSENLEDAKRDAEAYVRSTLLGYLQALGE